MIFISWDAFLFALPGLAGMGMNIICGYSNQMAMIFHYDLPMLPFLITGTLIGLAKLERRWSQGLAVEQINLRALGLILLSLTVSDKWPLFYTTHYLPSINRISARIAMLRLDRRVPVWVNERLSAQINQHDHFMIRDGGCSPEEQKDLENFKGYRIVDETSKPTEACPRPSFLPFFQNSEISIYLYPAG